MTDKEAEAGTTGLQGEMQAMEFVQGEDNAHSSHVEEDINHVIVVGGKKVVRHGHFLKKVVRYGHLRRRKVKRPEDEEPNDGRDNVQTEEVVDVRMGLEDGGQSPRAAMHNIEEVEQEDEKPHEMVGLDRQAELPLRGLGHVDQEDGMVEEGIESSHGGNDRMEERKQKDCLDDGGERGMDDLENVDDR